MISFRLRHFYVAQELEFGHGVGETCPASATNQKQEQEHDIRYQRMKKPEEFSQIVTNPSHCQ